LFCYKVSPPGTLATQLLQSWLVPKQTTTGFQYLTVLEGAAACMKSPAIVQSYFWGRGHGITDEGQRKVEPEPNKEVSKPRHRSACLRHRSLRPGHDLDLWSLTLRTFSAISTHMINICDKFYWNPSTKYRDISAHEIGVNGRTDGRLRDVIPPLPIAGGAINAQKWLLVHFNAFK